MKEEKEREEDKTKIKTAVEEGIVEWKRARASNQMTSPTTNDAGPEKECPKIVVKRMIKLVVVHARRMMVKALQNEPECEVAAALVDAWYSFLLLLLVLSLIQRIP